MTSAGRPATTVTEERARVIARDQVGKLNGQLTELRQRQAGVTTYYWRTSRDERVREAHDVLEGMLCRWDDPTVYSDDGGATWKPRSAIGAFEGQPGGEFQCRCSAESNVAQVLEALGI
jgi:SPP1 gp7 family putative phage head morphogenesis protein